MLADLAPIDAERKTRRLRSIWYAYAIAPSIAPSLVSITVFSMLFWPRERQVAETPTGFIIYPLVSLVAGLVVSYAVAGLISLPMIFALERSKMLSGFMISVVALASWWLFVAACCAISMLLLPANAGSTLRFGLLAALFYSPFVWASALAFTWVVHSGANGMSLRSIMILVTLFGVLSACVAPALRAFLSQVAQ